MAVEEIEGEDYMSDSAYALDANVTFSADGKSVYVYDLNGDDKVDEQDALVLLQAANGTHDALDAETGQGRQECRGRLRRDLRGPRKRQHERQLHRPPDRRRQGVAE